MPKKTYFPIDFNSGLKKRGKNRKYLKYYHGMIEPHRYIF